MPVQTTGSIRLNVVDGTRQPGRNDLEFSDSRGETLTPRAGMGKAALRNLWPLTKSYTCARRVLPSTLRGTRSSPSRSTQDYTPTLTNSSLFLFTMRCRRVV